MHRMAFKMKLFPNCEEEYKRRHDLIWPELSSLLQNAGIKEYSIFLEDSTGNLFGFLKVQDKALIDRLPEEPIMKKWWDYMKDLMETNPDHSPVSIPLREVFYMP
ncbi:MAG: L-rhamnose mutarotase [Bacteroidetes bacterium]|nr:L-rhamnose mutarotase [Bacteroidota bacterium]